MKKDLILMLVGAVAGSYAEYRLNYNLYDFAKDKIVAVLRFFHLHK